MTTIPTIFVNGDKKWYKDGQLHREDGPAIEWADGIKQWRINGRLHRTDGPAIEFPNGNKKWYINGELLTEKEFKKKINDDVNHSQKELLDMIISITESNTSDEISMKLIRELIKNK